PGITAAAPSSNHRVNRDTQHGKRKPARRLNAAPGRVRSWDLTYPDSHYPLLRPQPRWEPGTGNHCKDHQPQLPAPTGVPTARPARPKVLTSAPQEGCMFGRSGTSLPDAPESELPRRTAARSASILRRFVTEADRCLRRRTIERPLPRRWPAPTAQLE